MNQSGDHFPGHELPPVLFENKQEQGKSGYFENDDLPPLPESIKQEEVYLPPVPPICLIEEDVDIKIPLPDFSYGIDGDESLPVLPDESLEEKEQVDNDEIVSIRGGHLPVETLEFPEVHLPLELNDFSTVKFSEEKAKYDQEGGNKKDSALIFVLVLIVVALLFLFIPQQESDVSGVEGDRPKNREEEITQVETSVDKTGLNLKENKQNDVSREKALPSHSNPLTKEKTDTQNNNVKHSDDSKLKDNQEASSQLVQHNAVTDNKEQPVEVRKTAEEWIEEGHQYIEESALAPGEGSEKKAYDCYLSAAKMGSHEGLFRVGLCYYHGSGIDRNMHEALNCFRGAASKGHEESQLILYHLYKGGVGVKKDESEAFRYLTDAAKSNPTAQLILGEHYAKGSLGLEKNEEEAMDLIRRSLSRDPSPQGRILLAKLYYAKQERESHEKALMMIREDAEDGFIPAQVMVADCYIDKKGIPADITERERYEYIERWLGRAADKGDVDALYRLGIHFRRRAAQTTGVQRDNYKAEAQAALKQASELGSYEASEMLKEFFQNNAKNIK